MKLKAPDRKPDNISSKLEKRYAFYEKLIAELNQHELSDDITKFINDEVNRLDDISDSSGKKASELRSSANRIIKKIHKDLGLVPRNYNRNLWMGLGMAAFGIPMGVAFGVSLDNMAFMGIGLPIGLAIGMSVGANLDKKAKENGKQLNLDYDL